MRTRVRLASIISSTFFLAVPARSQSFGNADTVDRSVLNIRYSRRCKCCDSASDNVMQTTLTRESRQS